MLETKQAVSAPPRSAARSAPARAAAPSRAATPLPDPSPRRASSPAPGRLARSEARLLALAVMGTIVVCGLLVLYLAAYAHVSRLGMEQSLRRREWRASQQQNELLKAQLAALQNPQKIAKAARAQGMVLDAARVYYLAARNRPEKAFSPLGTSAAGGDAGTTGRQKRRIIWQDADIQVAINGKADNNASASPDH